MRRKTHLYLLHKSQQILPLMHKVENHCGLHSVNFLISFFHLIQHGKLGFPFPYIFPIILHRLYFLVEIVANDVADIPCGVNLLLPYIRLSSVLPYFPRDLNFLEMHFLFLYLHAKSYTILSVPCARYLPP